ncbi:hypothetical protein Runsl_0395 [Runella slithyformis DSM 19594]|uniref:Uncharacterized protein n=1 Tax=Runella slithyformis (strain ATCC 29530 / DSM 19594 / LMG 11500 / NCIMB 11436 / LSU 4) TaxID=761193 RepID=A0A7U3ZGL3_RUNSL|nr:hypothetical protein Runsl_0395 [Runella slithyformis DSM 19594]
MNIEVSCLINIGVSNIARSDVGNPDILFTIVDHVSSDEFYTV